MMKRRKIFSKELNRRLKAGEKGRKEILEEFPEFLPQMVAAANFYENPS